MPNNMLGRVTEKLVRLSDEILGPLYDLLEKLTGPHGQDWLYALNKFLRRENPWDSANVVANKKIVDLDAKPMRPYGWSIKKHVKGGQFEFDPSKVALYQPEEQKHGGRIDGDKFFKKLKGKLVFNANLLDFYLAHPNLIPEEWKEWQVFFWGTIYHDSDVGLVVRYLIWNGVRWTWSSSWLGDGWYYFCHAAVQASN